eukprot:CAMPEP_0181057186 /NCGR_PEP_ID=MMETSP1070-20121207/20113_1 /TAXON_ID=265543 /ORGANISM="Minutocellus polymorphus, Strain NH13" /LENGTH=67 /DNA_ID=CAMNT_0023136577 /DNA_START=884 /DNA_END=1087 /DNA_ORIENTATION=-
MAVAANGEMMNRCLHVLLLEDMFVESNGLVRRASSEVSLRHWSTQGFFWGPALAAFELLHGRRASSY